MKRLADVTVLLLLASLTGCASDVTQWTEAQDDSISRALDARVIDCTLPYLAQQAEPKALVRYRYARGATTFESDDRALVTHLTQCASTLDGPDVRFEREIEIWSTER